MVPLGVSFSPVGNFYFSLKPSPQPCQAIRFSPCPSFSQSSLKCQICRTHSSGTSKKYVEIPEEKTCGYVYGYDYYQIKPE